MLSKVCAAWRPEMPWRAVSATRSRRASVTEKCSKRTHDMPPKVVDLNVLAAGNDGRDGHDGREHVVHDAEAQGSTVVGPGLHDIPGACSDRGVLLQANDSHAHHPKGFRQALAEQTRALPEVELQRRGDRRSLEYGCSEGLGRATHHACYLGCDVLPLLVLAEVDSEHLVGCRKRCRRGRIRVELGAVPSVGLVRL